MAKSELYRDQFGYVNGRGRSKYWGVTFRVLEHGKDEWIITYRPDKEGAPTKALVADSAFTLSEEDAAIVAAMIYEQGCVDVPLVKSVLASDGKSVLTINMSNNKIYRASNNTGKVLWKFEPTNNLFGAVQVATPRKGEPKAKEPVSTSNLVDFTSGFSNSSIEETQQPSGEQPLESLNEIQFTGEVMRRAVEGKLSKRSIRIIIGALRGVLGE